MEATGIIHIMVFPRRYYVSYSRVLILHVISCSYSAVRFEIFQVVGWLPSIAIFKLHFLVCLYASFRVSLFPFVLTFSSWKWIDLSSASGQKVEDFDTHWDLFRWCVLHLLSLRINTLDEAYKCISNLHSLIILYCDRCGTGDSNLEHLKSLIHLEYVNFSETNVTDTGMVFVGYFCLIRGLVSCFRSVVLERVGPIARDCIMENFRSEQKRS
jgi:hypothetical protein